jgi:mono/diheme cytochrome c family protein
MLSAVALASGGAVADERTLNDAVYSRSQAQAGKKLYQQYCVSCHAKGYFGPVMRGRQGQPLSALFDAMVALMPQNAPGSLTDQQYLDIMAYIMSVERYPYGDSPLAIADLGTIEIRSPE